MSNRKPIREENGRVGHPDETSGSSLLLIRDRLPIWFRQSGLLLLFGPLDDH